MSDSFVVEAFLREDLGKGASRRLRHSDMVPAIVYGAQKDPMSIKISHLLLYRALENESFYTRILTLKLNGNDEKVILRDIQRHPYRPRITHVDFQRISAKEKITMHIPLHFKGAELSPGVKLKGGVVSHLLSEVEIRCLPGDLPEYIDVDLSGLEIDQTVHLSDLKLPPNTEIHGLIRNSTNDQPVVSLHLPRAAVEETTGAPISAAVETVAEAKAKAAEAEEAKAAEGGAKDKGK